MHSRKHLRVPPWFKNVQNICILAYGAFAPLIAEGTYSSAVLLPGRRYTWLLLCKPVPKKIAVTTIH